LDKSVFSSQRLVAKIKSTHSYEVCMGGGGTLVKSLNPHGFLLIYSKNTKIIYKEGYGGKRKGHVWKLGVVG
jgi:hypothetical protein